MKSRTRSIVLAINAALAAVALSGCAAAHPSDHEALQAATNVYRLQLATEAVLAETGAWMDAPFAETASDAYISQLHAQFDVMAAKGLSVTGPAKWVKSKLLEFSERDATSTVVMLVCLDRTGQITHDTKNGISITGGGKQARETQRVTVSGSTLKRLKVAQVTPVPPADSICGAR
ncbi:MAG TPA: hypothetical protein VFU07_00930 [Candidatus Lumbricidophila sp.]|nr:hypothetical protein [Candidatus Lumbricidophila sp.]